MARCENGFTLIELMVALAVIAILATLALPSYHSAMTRDQIVAAVPLGEIVKAPIALAWATTQSFPADNASAGLPSADKIVNNHISSIAVDNGAIQITFGNSANRSISGKILTLRPAVVEDAPIVPVAWVCGYAAGPDKMTIQGENKTNIANNYLPLNCRGKS